MAKRFGRNRRRHLREEAAKCRQVVDIMRQDAMFEQARVARLEAEMRKWEADIRNMLGPKSAFTREVEKIRVQRFSRFYEMASRHEERAFSPSSTSYGTTYEELRERMYCFQVLVMDNPEQYAQHIRFIEVNEGSEVSYLISQTALAHGLSIDVMARHIAEQIVLKWNDHYRPQRRANG